MKKPCILITGGAGFIGSHVNKRLNQAGYDTVIFDNLSSGFRNAVVAGKFIQGDVRDYTALKNLFEQTSFDAVMHFAALKDVGESVCNPVKYYQQNVGYTLNLLEFSLEKRIPFIFSSSAAVYGIPMSSPLTESHPLSPINPYGSTKKTVEEILASCRRSNNLPFVSLRYFNAAGGDPEKEIRNFHTHECNLIPRVLKSIRRHCLHAEVFGNDYPTRDGTCVRDYIHVSDLADAHLAAMEYLFEGGEPGAFNLGNEQGYTVCEVLKAIQNIVNVNLSIEFAPRRPGDPPELIACSQKARTELNWTPRFPSIEKIIEDAWEAMNLSH